MSRAGPGGMEGRRGRVPPPPPGRVRAHVRALPGALRRRPRGRPRGDPRRRRCARADITIRLGRVRNILRIRRRDWSG
eukprot:1182092-Prorocentrum_minimum.AAC.2